MAPYRRILSHNGTNGTECSGDCSPRFPPPPPTPPSHDRHLVNLVIAAACLIAAAFFLALTYCAVFSRHRLRRRHPSFAFASEAGDYPESDGDHPLWHIRTVGLDDAAIASIGVFEYSARDALIAAADCSVCLAEFADGEIVRLLPKCFHAFHVPCIDPWLQAHINCPLCRAPVLPPPEESSSPLGVRDNASLSAGSDPGMSFEDDLEADVSAYLSVASSHPPSSVPSGLEEDGSELVRRSVSLPVVETEGGSFREEEKETSIAGEQSSNAKGKQGSSSKEIEKSSSGKSSSGSGRGFFFSKNGRSRSTVLPS